jgi:RND family efflux transporter MFP subunit
LPGGLPIALLTGFVLLFLLLFRDRLLPAPTVRVASVLGLPAEAAGVGGGATRFEASGWVEPDPQPIRAACLTDGVVDTVAVREGDLVRQGDVLATLVREDAELEVERVQRRLAWLEAEAAVQAAGVDAARSRQASAQAGHEGAATQREEAADIVRRLAALPPEAVADSELVAARLRLQREEHQRQAAGLVAEEARAERERAERLAQAKRAEIALAEVELARARLDLARTRITAPVDGRVLHLLAAPGQKLRWQSDEPESSTIAILYPPDRLQVRVDVPLAEAGRLRPGQSARIHTALLPERELTGTVTRIAGAADLQRNALQAKVRLHDPPAALRPEMLCRVSFLDEPSTAAAAPPSALTLWVPTAAVREEGVWICDPDSHRVSRRAVIPTGTARDGRVSLREGVRPGEWVVLDPSGLREGGRVRPQWEEP